VHAQAGQAASADSTQAASYTPSAANLASRQAFQDAKFGLFIHWGVYSVLGAGEWVMNNKKMTIAEYEKLPPAFNPTAFNAAEWVSLAKAAGMKYITITSKHHDGFASSIQDFDYDIVDRTVPERHFKDAGGRVSQTGDQTLFLSFPPRLASSGLFPSRPNGSCQRPRGER
jgi:hypothetical protein